MHRSLIPVLATLSLAAASPIAAAAQDPPTCSSFLSMIDQASASASATDFCSSFLHISTSTRTITPTVTPSPVTVTETSTSTEPTLVRQSTVSRTDTVTVTSTTTLPSQTSTQTVTLTSTSTFSCFSAATILTPSVQSAMAKRAETPPPLPTPSVFTSVTDPVVTSACQCFSLTGSTVTVTSPTTLAPRTVTTTVVVTSSPVTTTTTTAVATSTVTKTNTVTPSSTATVTKTATLVVPTPGASGLDYYVYQNNQLYERAGATYDPASFQNNNFFSKGRLEDINSISYNDGVARLPGGNVNGDGVAIVMQGFYYAPTAGAYRFFTTGIDNQLTVWHGNVAYGGAANRWTFGNADYDALRAGGDASQYRDGAITLTLAAGQVVPFTIIFGNSSGIGKATFYVTMPDGTTVTTTKGRFTPQCPAGPFSP